MKSKRVVQDIEITPGPGFYSPNKPKSVVNIKIGKAERPDFYKKIESPSPD